MKHRTPEEVHRLNHRLLVAIVIVSVLILALLVLAATTPEP